MITMDRKIWVLIALIVVALAGFGYYYWSSGSPTGSGSEGKPSPSFEIESVSVSQKKPFVEDTVKISGTVKNTGETGSELVTFRLDGSTVSEENIKIPSGESKKVQVEAEISEKGKHTVKVENTFENFQSYIKPPTEGQWFEYRTKVIYMNGDNVVASSKLEINETKENY